MAAKKVSADEPNFEDALIELEAIVRAIEEGNLNLDGALAQFEKGIALSRICAKKLDQVEKKIDMLLAGENGEYILKPADITEEPNE